MKKKILVILICTLMMAVTSLGVLGQTIEVNPKFEPLYEEPTSVEKVKEVPVPWQFWQDTSRGLKGIIVLHESTEDNVTIVGEIVVLDKEIPLENLTWGNTMNYSWEPINESNDITLAPGDSYEFFIEIPTWGKAVLVRFPASWAETPDVIEAHFINEAIIETRGIVGVLTNFDVHNSYDGDINNFELELYGDIEPDDVEFVYDWPSEPQKYWYDYLGGYLWLFGWGVTDDFQNNSKPYGIEIVWMDKEHPVEYCEWIHFGVHLKPNAYVDRGALADLTITTPRDVSHNPEITMHRNIQYPNTLFLYFIQNHPNLFPILRNLLRL